MHRTKTTLLYILLWAMFATDSDAKAWARAAVARMRPPLPRHGATEPVTLAMCNAFEFLKEHFVSLFTKE